MILGDGGVGKTSILKNYDNQNFSIAHICTIGIDYVKTTFEKDGRKVGVKLWDTAGQERFRTITYQFYRQTDGIILAFDITSRLSFKNTSIWLASIYKHADPNISKILVGNKLDLKERREVDAEEARKLAEEH